MDNGITNLIFQLEEFCRLADPSWKNVLIKVEKIYEKHGDISYLEIEDNLIFIDENGEIVRCLYE
ncbi:hypothetical protein G6Z30_10860 [Clostridium perfringens]|uniref:hypothetical protein n=1 Tax=Clostridium perfringens TaxID=1502 RepID=UPI0013E2978D|nr:hypothetical protein [Clostridium perfringens]NGU48071.1 hypothetical protein [Clostridium perfringens]